MVLQRLLITILIHFLHSCIILLRALFRITSYNVAVYYYVIVIVLCLCYLLLSTIMLADSLTDKALAALTHHCAHTLERIDLSFIRHITLPVFLHFLSMCVAMGKAEMEVTVWGCSQLRRTVKEETLKKSSAATSTDRAEVESGNVLDQLRQIKNNASGVVNNMNFDVSGGDTLKLPTILGFLDI